MAFGLAYTLGFDFVMFLVVMLMAAGATGLIQKRMNLRRVK
jgi:hypothetical protein